MAMEGKLAYAFFLAFVLTLAQGSVLLFTEKDRILRSISGRVSALRKSDLAKYRSYSAEDIAESLGREVWEEVFPVVFLRGMAGGATAGTGLLLGSVYLGFLKTLIVNKIRGTIAVAQAADALNKAHLGNDFLIRAVAEYSQVHVDKEKPTLRTKKQKKKKKKQSRRSPTTEGSEMEEFNHVAENLLITTWTQEDELELGAELWEAVLDHTPDLQGATVAGVTEQQQEQQAESGPRAGDPLLPEGHPYPGASGIRQRPGVFI